jgi:hypothetical protein
MKWFAVPAKWSPWLRAAWVVLQIVASVWMARSGIHFYYQGF